MDVEKLEGSSGRLYVQIFSQAKTLLFSFLKFGLSEL